MTTPLSNGVWKNSLATSVSVICGVIIAEAATGGLQTKAGWIHFGIVAGSAVLVAEARYWKDWADSVLGTGK